MEHSLKIGEVARRSGVSTRTIRYYEMLGLLDKPQRSDSGYRMYGPRDVERLAFINKAKNLGFSLAEVQEVLEIHNARASPCVHVLAILDRKVYEIDQLVRDFRMFQRQLRRLREESAALVQRSSDGSAICTIVDRGIHVKGQQAITWLESQRKRSG